VALSHLSKFLRIQSLQDDVQAFIGSDLKLANAGVYMATAARFQDETLSEKAREKCLEEVIDKCPIPTKVASLQFAVPWAESMISRIQKQPLWDFVTRNPAKRS